MVNKAKSPKKGTPKFRNPIKTPPRMSFPKNPSGGNYGSPKKGTPKFRDPINSPDRIGPMPGEGGRPFELPKKNKKDLSTWNLLQW